MSLKKQRRRDFQKSLVLIVDAYLDQKDKKKRKQLRKFIKEKVIEVLFFNDRLSKNKDIKEINNLTIGENDNRFSHTSCSVFDASKQNAGDQQTSNGK